MGRDRGVRVGPPVSRRAAFRAPALAYVSLWALTGVAAAVTAVCGPAAHEARMLLALTLDARSNPPPTVSRALALAAHNIPIASWPLLLYTAGARGTVGRRAADLAVIVSVSTAAIPVGAAFGAYGPPLLPFVAQLPAEWAAVALGAGAWLRERRAPICAAARLRLFAMICLLLLGAAVIETAWVPHRPRGAVAAPHEARGAAWTP